ncbi:hypothetical protein NPIL_361381 [Nephila pilipes]|uniref:Uncharacterized protein n=1 Tax=Nephila pilipes TaxID=299642 RepID=A0A8X6NQZ0_NEPPI|nr:hypothetical protein NPIL_361381 [Nephila pilipes]
MEGLCRNRMAQVQLMTLPESWNSYRSSDKPAYLTTREESAGKVMHVLCAGQALLVISPMHEFLDNCSICQLLREDMDITQELEGYSTVTGKDIFNELKKPFADYNLDWNNLSCQTDDG